MLENILLFFGIMWLFLTLYIVGIIITNAKDENYKTICLSTLKEFLIKLFSGKNWFGIILSVIVLIISIPAMLLILIVQILFYVSMGIGYVWRLGNKK